MSYQVFHLKYRPQNFDEIVGQPHIVKTLQNEILHNRIANAYLFAGPRGVGKTTTARIMGKALNCINGPTIKPCNSCPSCVEIQKGTSLDVVEIDGASNRGIEEVRELRENVKYAPTRGKYKLYIIDEVHMLTQEAFNALLKTIEEPPSFVIFILATTLPHKLPLTILSRCQRFSFKKIGNKIIAQRLKYIAQTEGIKLEESASYFIATLVDGALRDAISILDQLISFTEEKITKKEVELLLGLPMEESLSLLGEAIFFKEVEKIFTITQKMFEEGISPSTLLTSLIHYFQDLFLKKMGVLEEEITSSLYPEIPPSLLLEMTNLLFEIERSLRGVLSRERYLQQGLIKIAITLGKQREEKEEKFLDIFSTWQKLKEKLKPSLASIVGEVRIKEVTNGKVILVCKNEFVKERIEENLKIIEDEMRKLTSIPFKLVIFQPEKTKNIAELPIVKEALKIFEAKIYNVRRI